MIVVIVHQTVIDGDAIGHDIIGMYQALSETGVNVFIYAENCIGSLAPLRVDKKKLMDIINRKDNVLIYHHSIYWEEGEKILSMCKAKIVFKFHNITPPEFFKPYSSMHYIKTNMGTEQTGRFLTKYADAVWWCDSDFNCKTLVKYGITPEMIAIVPPFTVLENFSQVEPNFDIIDSLLTNSKNNILFVGRVAPNKGHIHMIEVTKRYTEMYDREICLWIVGGLDRDNLQPYNQLLRDLIRRYDLESNVVLTDKRPIEDIKAFYLGCNEMLCLSEHEGFCVPVIESQYLGLPLVTHDCCALSETAGKDQIIMSSLDYSEIAAALYTLFTDEEVRDFCQSKGFDNIRSRFLNSQIKNTFREKFYEALRGQAE